MQELYADFNDIVKKGQVIARLDPHDPRDADRAAASERHARRRRTSSGCEVTLADAKQKLDRAKALSEKNLMPRTELETAEVNVKSAEAQIKSSEAGLVQAKSQLHTSRSQPASTPSSPRRSTASSFAHVEPGQTVNAGMNAPTLFILAADLTKMQVIANIDEADVGRMRPGQTVRSASTRSQPRRSTERCSRCACSRRRCRTS